MSDFVKCSRGSIFLAPINRIYQCCHARVSLCINFLKWGLIYDTCKDNYDFFSFPYNRGPFGFNYDTLILFLLIFILILGVCAKEADIVFVLDMSSSIEAAGQGNWNQMLTFVVNIVNKLSISEQGVHVGVVTFSDDSNIEFLLDAYYDKNALTAAILGILYKGGNTNTSSGLRRMQNNVFDPTNQGLRGDRLDVQNLAIVITDGGSNVNKEDTIPSADRAKADGIKIVAVGITRSVNETELRGISSTGIEGETLFRSDDFNVADDIVQTIVNQTCGIIETGMAAYIFCLREHYNIFLLINVS